MRHVSCIFSGSTDPESLADRMKQTCMKAYGKVNLGIDVTGIREDGYHLVRMIMQSVDLYDDVTVEVMSHPKSFGQIGLSCDDPRIPADKSNLAYRAAQLICAQYPDAVRDVRIHIGIQKRIPAAAGMGGGSADAAAVIRGMDKCLDLKMSLKEQDSIALRIGADVPFCLRKGTYLAEGIGEKLTKVTDLSPCFMVIVKPDFGVSTPWAYKKLDEWMNTSGTKVNHPDIDRLIRALSERDISSIADSMGNILEPAVIGTYPEIQNIKDSLVEYGAVKALMSGSGPTVFGIFNDAEKAETACSHLGGGKKYGKFKVEF